MLRSQERDNIVVEREWRQANPEEAALDDARVRARNHPQLEPDGGDFPDAVEAPLVPAIQVRVTKCSNPFCNITGTKLHDQMHQVIVQFTILPELLRDCSKS